MLASVRTCTVHDFVANISGAKCRQIRQVEGLQTLIMASGSPSTSRRPLRGSAAAVEGVFSPLSPPPLSVSAQSTPLSAPLEICRAGSGRLSSRRDLVS